VLRMDVDTALVRICDCCGDLIHAPSQCLLAVDGDASVWIVDGCIKPFLRAALSLPKETGLFEVLRETRKRIGS
jgi:hypothetical protein